MFFSKAKIDYEDLPVFLAKNKIRCLHISMDETSFVDFAYRYNHLHQDLYGNLEVIALLKTTSSFSQVYAKQIHNNEILFRILDVFVRVCDVLEPYKFKTRYIEELK